MRDQVNYRDTAKILQTPPYPSAPVPGRKSISGTLWRNRSFPLGRLLAETSNWGVKNIVVELRKNRNLFTRMIIVWKSRPKIGIQEVVDTYEFSSLPGSMLVADGTLLRFSCKTALWNTFKKLPVNLDGDNDSAANQSTEDGRNRSRCGRCNIWGSMHGQTRMDQRLVAYSS